jgi:hypothetical protein
MTGSTGGYTANGTETMTERRGWFLCRGRLT